MYAESDLGITKISSFFSPPEFRISMQNYKTYLTT